MNHGPGWVIFEESFHQRTKNLLSILPARKSVWEIERVVEQMYVDRHFSIKEKLAYKKSRKHIIYKPLTDPYSCIIHYGHEPFLVAIPARKILLRGNQLEIHYRIAVNRDDPMNPVFEARQQIIPVETFE
jgi:hypothetical protein